MKDGYYYIANGEQKGPHNLEELKDLGVTRSTLVWKEGLSDWVAAGEIEELKAMLPPCLPSQNRGGDTPSIPPIVSQPSQKAISPSVKKKIWSRTWFRIAAGVIAALILIKIISSLSNRESRYTYEAPSGVVQSTPSPEEAIQANERTNASSYIECSVSSHKNLLGEFVMVGSFFSTAKYITYKDPVLEFRLLSRTGSEVGTIQKTAYVKLPPGKQVQLDKIKLSVSSDVKDFKFSIVDATPIN